MGIFDSIKNSYNKVDAKLGGILPGGVPYNQPTTTTNVIPAQTVPAPTITAPINYGGGGWTGGTNIGSTSGGVPSTGGGRTSGSSGGTSGGHTGSGGFTGGTSIGNTAGGSFGGGRTGGGPGGGAWPDNNSGSSSGGGFTGGGPAATLANPVAARLAPPTQPQFRGNPDQIFQQQFIARENQRPRFFNAGGTVNQENAPSSYPSMDVNTFPFVQQRINEDRAIRENIPKVGQAIVAPVSTLYEKYDKPYAERAARENVIDYFGGRSYGSLNLVEQKGTSQSVTRQLTTEELSKLPYGAGIPVIAERTVADIQYQAQQQGQALVQGYQQQYNDYASQVQSYINDGSVTYEQGKSMLKQYGNELQNRADKDIKMQVQAYVDQRTADLNLELTKAQKKSISANAFSVPRLAAAAADTAAIAGGAMFLAKPVQVGLGLVGGGILGYEAGMTGVNFAQGNPEEATFRIANIGAGLVGAGIGVKAYSQVVETPKIARAYAAMNHPDTVVRPETRGITVDNLISKYRLDADTEVLVKDIVNRGGSVIVKTDKLYNPSSNINHNLPNIHSDTIILVDRNGNVVEYMGVGTFVGKSNGKTLTKDVVSFAQGIIEGSSTRSYTRVIEGKLKGDQFIPAKEFEYLQSTGVQNVQRESPNSMILNIGSKTSLLEETGVTPRASWSMRQASPEENLGDTFRNFFGRKKISEQGVRDLLSMKEQQTTPLPISEGEMDIKLIAKEPSTATISNAVEGEGFSAVFGEQYKLASRETRTKGIGQTRSVFLSEGSKNFRELPQQSGFMDFVKPKPSSPAKENPIAPLPNGGSTGNPLVGDRTETFSQSLYGAGYGKNYGGGFKVPTSALGFAESDRFISFGKEVAGLRSNTIPFSPITGRPTVTARRAAVLGFSTSTGLGSAVLTPQQPKTKSSTMEDTGLGITNVPIQRSHHKNVETTSVSESFGLGQPQANVQGLSTRMNTRLKTPSITTNDFGFDLTPPTTETPTPFTDRNEEDAVRTSFGFVPEAKVRGQFIQLSKPVSKSRALSIGSRFADTTLARTFRITPTKAKVKQERPFSVDLSKFRTFQQKGGQRMPLQNTFIERSQYALEPSEVSIIRPLARRGQIQKARRGIGSFFGV